MAQTARNRRNGNMGGYQQAGIGVPQTVEVYRQQVIRCQKARKPRCYRLGVDGCAVSFGKQQVIFHRLTLYFHLAHPLGTDFEPFRFLVFAVFL